jgi:hypothetical protein
MLIDLSERDFEVILEALDSHAYWQLSDESRHNSGYVMEPYTEAEREVMALEERLQTHLRRTT